MTAIISAVPANLVVDATAIVADANTVVFHDMAAVATDPARLASRAYKELEDIAAAKVTWETTVYRTSNDQLYTVLQRCYGLYATMNGNGDTAVQLTVAVDKYLAEQGHKRLSKSHTLAKIVKAVFGADRRRVSAYNRALQAALAAKIAVADLPQYIRSAGGVEQLRLAKSSNTPSRKQKTEEAKRTTSEHILAKLKLDVLAGRYDEGRIGARHVLIVTQGADGYFDLNAIVSSDAAVNAALVAFHNQQAKQAAEAAPEQQQTSRETAVSDLINEAAQSVLQ